MEPSEDPLSTQCTQGKPLATSLARQKAKNPWGLRPHWVFGLWSGRVLKGPPRAPFTMIHLRLSHRFSFFLPNALVYCVKQEKTNRQTIFQWNPRE